MAGSECRAVSATSLSRRESKNASFMTTTAAAFFWLRVAKAASSSRPRLAPAVNVGRSRTLPALSNSADLGVAGGAARVVQQGDGAAARDRLRQYFEALPEQLAAHQVDAGVPVAGMGEARDQTLRDGIAGDDTDRDRARGRFRRVRGGHAAERGENGRAHHHDLVRKGRAGDRSGRRPIGTRSSPWRRRRS